MAERTAIIGSDAGLHARPAAILAEAAASQTVEITIDLLNDSAYEAGNASSAPSLISLRAGKGDTVVLRADGKGAEQVPEELAAVLEHNHDQP